MTKYIIARQSLLCPKTTIYMDVYQNWSPVKSDAIEFSSENLAVNHIPIESFRLSVVRNNPIRIEELDLPIYSIGCVKYDSFKDFNKALIGIVGSTAANHILSIVHLPATVTLKDGTVIRKE